MCMHASYHKAVLLDKTSGFNRVWQKQTGVQFLSIRHFISLLTNFSANFWGDCTQSVWLVQRSHRCQNLSKWEICFLVSLITCLLQAPLLLLLYCWNQLLSSLQHFNFNYVASSKKKKKSKINSVAVHDDHHHHTHELAHKHTPTYVPSCFLIVIFKSKTDNNHNQLFASQPLQSLNSAFLLFLKQQ